MPGSGRRPINAPAGSPQAAGVPWVGLGILLVLVLLLAAFVAHFFFGVGDDEGDQASAPAPALTDREAREGGTDVSGHRTGALGYPAAATRNTTRIDGNDPVDLSIAASLAAYPTTGPGSPPEAVTLVDSEDWQSGVVAATLSARPVGAPIMLAPSGVLSGPGSDALAQLNPQGSPTTRENQVFTVGSVAPPSGYQVRRIAGPDPATLAARVADLKAELNGGPPSAFVVVSSEEAAFATPAATWAARSGDVVLFTGPDELPPATIAVLRQEANENVPVFVLGPSSAVSSRVVRQLNRVAASVERVGGEDPATAAVELVRFS